MQMTSGGVGLLVNPVQHTGLLVQQQGGNDASGTVKFAPNVAPPPQAVLRGEPIRSAAPPRSHTSRPSLVPDTLRASIAGAAPIVPPNSQLPPLEGRGPAPPLAPRRRQSSMRDFASDMQGITASARQHVQGFWHHTTPALPLPLSPRLHREVRIRTLTPDNTKDKGKTPVYKLQQQGSSSSQPQAIRPLSPRDRGYTGRGSIAYPHPHDAPPISQQPTQIVDSGSVQYLSGSMTSAHPFLQPTAAYPEPAWAQPAPPPPLPEHPGFLTLPNGYSCVMCSAVTRQPWLHTFIPDGGWCFNGQSDFDASGAASEHTGADSARQQQGAGSNFREHWQASLDAHQMQWS